MSLKIILLTERSQTKRAYITCFCLYKNLRKCKLIYYDTLLTEKVMVWYIHCKTITTTKFTHTSIILHSYHFCMCVCVCVCARALICVCVCVVKTLKTYSIKNFQYTIWYCIFSKLHVGSILALKKHNDLALIWLCIQLVFLPGESQGQGSLVDCRLWGRTESDTTEVT